MLPSAKIRPEDNPLVTDFPFEHPDNCQESPGPLHLHVVDECPKWKPDDSAAPHAVTVVTPRATSSQQRQQSPKPLGSHERLLPKAEEAARMLAHCWIQYGPKHLNHFDPDDMPTGPLQGVAEGILHGMLHDGVRDFAGLVAYFGDAPKSIRDELLECAQGFAPMPSDCGPLLERLHSYRRALQFEKLHHKLRNALDQGEPTADIIKELAQVEAGTSAKSRSMIVAGVNSFPTIVPTETVVLGESWIRIGDILNLVSGAGMGKSVVGFQAPMAWGLGLPYLGIKPPRPLRILIFSGEDDGVTIGQCREGFLVNSKAITGRQLAAADLALLDSMIRTEFIREHVGERFHPHLASLLRESPVDLVIINPLLSYIGGEIVACASEWLRAGLMPILQDHQCAALVLHHTPKLSKDSWNLMDDTYSAIGGGEVANIPRSILTLKPTPAGGLFVLTVSKRQTCGWRDGNGKFVTSYFMKRSGNPERPAWIPVPYDEAEDLIASGVSAGSSGRSSRKVTDSQVVEALQVGPTQRQALIDRLMKNCRCSDKPAKNAIRDALLGRLILATSEPSGRGGNPIQWLSVPEHKTHGVA